MTATRYLVEGGRLDVLIGQMKRMGRRITVLKAERVRKSGLAGVFLKEHYEIPVKVEEVGEPPERFSNVAATATVAPMCPRHHTLSEQAQDAGSFRERHVTRSTRSDGDGSGGLKVGDTAALGASPDADDSGSGADQKDEGLRNLLNEARSQLDSGTEVAAADLGAQLAAMGISQTPPVAPHESAPNPATNPSGLRSGTAVMDARLQGVAAPGRSGLATPRPVINHSPAAQRVAAEQATKLGFPSESLVEMPVDGSMEIGIDDFVVALPQPVELLEKPGSAIVVIRAAPITLSVVEAVQRLAGRLSNEGCCVLGGPKTTLPGKALRTRSTKELRQIMDERPGQTRVLTLADSLMEVHRRTMSKLISMIYIDQTWAMVDGRSPLERTQSWLKGLPDALHPDTLAVQRIWEAGRPGELLEIDIPIGMLDGVPARDGAWKMLLEDILGSGEEE